jgi:hypothetical protein
MPPAARARAWASSVCARSQATSSVSPRLARNERLKLSETLGMREHIGRDHEAVGGVRVVADQHPIEAGLLVVRVNGTSMMGPSAAFVSEDARVAIMPMNSTEMFCLLQACVSASSGPARPGDPEPRDRSSFSCLTCVCPGSLKAPQGACEVRMLLCRSPRHFCKTATRARGTEHDRRGRDDSAAARQFRRDGRLPELRAVVSSCGSSLRTAAALSVHPTGTWVTVGWTQK